MTLTLPGGIFDLDPPRLAARRRLEEVAARLARAYGFSELEPALLDPRALVERSAGEGSDVVRKELYSTEDELVLRPELTAGTLRAFFETELVQRPRPARLFACGPVFRRDRPQKGRQRQFTQFSVESLGEPSVAEDALLIELAWAIFRELGLRRVELALNSIGCLDCRAAYLAELSAWARPRLSELCADCQERSARNPLRLLDCKSCRELTAQAPAITDRLCAGCADQFSRLRALLDAARISYRIEPRLVRGLDYYGGTVFEFTDPRLEGAQNTLCGGGRYDGLASSLGWPVLPAAGFAIGLERLVSAVEEKMAPLPQPVWVLPTSESLETQAMALARRLRDAGAACTVGWPSRSLKARMRAASGQGVRWVVIFNEQEAERGVAQLKDLDSGEQLELNWVQISSRIAG